MRSQEYKPLSIPDWLKSPEVPTHPEDPLKSSEKRFLSARESEGFIDKTLRHTLRIIEDTIFNEKTSKKKGLLQMINPLLKIISIISFIVVVSIQRSFLGIIPFLFIGITLLFLSRINPLFMLKKILPLSTLTFLIALPATLSLIVEGTEVLNLYTFQSPQRILGINLPEKISITEEGLISMLTLLMRVSCSVLFVFLLTMTTRPDRFIKSLMIITPKIFRPIIGITYRYIFFLTRKVEEFIMGLESRRIIAMGQSKGRRWVASRIGLLFSISHELSKDLSLAMQSRGYSDSLEGWKSISGYSKRIDIAWLIFSISINGLVIWKFLI